MMLLGPLVVLALASGLESHPVYPDGNSACQDLRDVLGVLQDVVPARCLVQRDPWAIVEEMTVSPIVKSKCMRQTAETLQMVCSHGEELEDLHMCLMMNDEDQYELNQVSKWRRNEDKLLFCS